MIGTIESIAFGGEGIFRHEGKVIFVPFTLPGEQVEVEITDERKNFAKGKLLRIITPSLERITPRCPYFGTCGGCQLQHMTYDAQLAYKKQAVQHSLEKIGKLTNLPPITIQGTPIQWEYRRHISLKKQGDKLGFIGYDNHTFVPIKKCIIYADHDLPYVKSTSPFTINDMTFFSSPTAFVQNHPEQSATLYNDLLSLVIQYAPTTLLDLYCGIGVTSILLAPHVPQITGVEKNRTAILLAKKNAAYNHIKNVSFIAGDAANAKMTHKDLVIVNPPRIGLLPEMTARLIKARPPTIIYISCMPSTLARDIQRLSGYTVEHIKAYDMFPQTAHVETLVALTRNTL